MAAPFVGAGIGFIVGGPAGAVAGWGVGELVGNAADAVNTGWYLGESGYYASQGDSEKAQEALKEAAWSGVGLIPFGNILGKGGKWLGKTKVGQWGGDALEALGKTKVGQWGGDALEWAGKQGGKAVDWLGQQGGKALDWAGKQREQVIKWGGDALNWAGKQGDNLLKPLDDLLTGRNLEMAGVPRGAIPNIDTPTPKPRPKSPTHSPHSKAPNVDPANPARVEPEAPVPRNADGTADISNAKPESVPARESSVTDSGRIESDQLSDRQIKNELDHIKDNPNLVEGTPPNRKAKVGEHEWHEQPGGGWCRHSDGEVCVIDIVNPESGKVFGKYSKGEYLEIKSKGSLYGGNTIKLHPEKTTTLRK
jgi:hypothetical protein